ncbi:MAG TPA: hypothetical protein VF275_01965 [Gammaproteobacteria bacterium]
MRAEEMALLLLAIIFLVFLGGKVALSAREQAEPPPAPATGPWKYDHRSPYYSFLPREARLFRSDAPREVADRICRSMGGKLHFLRSSTPKKQAKVGFNCLFLETGKTGGITISTDFGDLSRIPARIE